MTLRDGLTAVKLLLGLVVTMAVGVATYVAYDWYKSDYRVSTDDDGVARARVVRATLFGRNELRVAQLSGVVQGTARASRFWGWLNATQVVKAPFTVDYFVPLGKLSLRNFHYDRDRRVLFVDAPSMVIERANVDLANTTLNDVGGLFVTRGQMVEMSTKVAASSQRVAAERANSSDNVERGKAFARRDLEQLFQGVLEATGLDARVEVRFPGEPRVKVEGSWDLSLSLKEVLGNAN